MFVEALGFFYFFLILSFSQSGHHIYTQWQVMCIFTLQRNKCFLIMTAGFELAYLQYSYKYTLLHPAQLDLCGNAFISTQTLECIFCSSQDGWFCFLKCLHSLWHQESLGWHGSIVARAWSFQRGLSAICRTKRRREHTVSFRSGLFHSVRSREVFKQSWKITSNEYGNKLQRARIWGVYTAAARLSSRVLQSARNDFSW